MADSTGLFSNLSTGNLIGAGISLIPSIYKGVASIFQKNKANKINPANPGYQMNTAIIDNARVLSEKASNYQMPGYGSAVQNIQGDASTAFNNGVQGASSGGDVLDLATKIAYGSGKRLNDLAAMNAQGAENAQSQALQANAQAGQEYVNKNAYDRDIYQQQLREKAALTQSSNENAYGALDTGANVINSILNPTPTNGTNNGTGALTPAQIEAYNKNRARLRIAS